MPWEKEGVGNSVLHSSGAKLLNFLLLNNPLTLKYLIASTIATPCSEFG